METKHLRILAALLATGGVGWGLLCLPVLLDFDPAWKRALLLFVPGYLVTAGYLVRCIGRPSPTWGRAIWGASALVQGAWLAYHIGQTVAQRDLSEYLISSAFLIPGGWWIFSFAASVYGLLVEPGKQAP
jgi:hypothetical protein